MNVRTAICVCVGLLAAAGMFLLSCGPRDLRVVGELPDAPFHEPALLPRLPLEQGASADPADLEAAWRNHAWPTREWQYIVVHHSATPAGNAYKFDLFHRDEPRLWDELGYHFVIGNGSDSGDGQVEIGSRWRKQKHGAHTRSPSGKFNQSGIGICLVGDFDVARPTEAQWAGLLRLCRFLCREYKVSPAAVLGHRHAQITEGKPETSCPGANFDLVRLRRELAEPGGQ